MGPVRDVVQLLDPAGAERLRSYGSGAAADRARPPG